MTPADARAVLGVDATATWGEVRAAYRRAVRATHPDRHHDDPTATARTAAVTAAYAVLRDATAAAAPSPSPSPSPASAAAAAPGGVELFVEAPPDEAFHILFEAAHALGEVAYVDADVGLFEVIITDRPGEACSLLVTFQGRGARTEAFCTIEPLGDHPCPGLDEAVGRLIDAVRTTGGGPAA